MFDIGKAIKHSPVGSGEITDITEAGYPQVNGVAVAWLVFEDGCTFNPFGHDIDKLIKEHEEKHK